MSKGWIADRVNFSLIISILAVVSITLNSTSPNLSVVEAKTNIKTNNTDAELKSSLINSSILAMKIEDSEVFPKEFAKTDNLPQNVPAKEEDKNDNLTTVRKKWVTVTAYSSTPDQTDSSPFITASGTHVHSGTIASNFLKFGTKVRFPSIYPDRIFVVEDRMKSDTKVDIWFPTRDEAKKFGAKRLEIEILQ